MRNVLKSLCISVGLIGSSATWVHAEQFDASFNGNGRYISSFTDIHALATLEQPNGNLLLVGTQTGGCGAATACVQFTYLDATGSFVVGTSPINANMESIVAAATDSRGRTILVGTSVPALSVGGRNFRVLRYLQGGAILDTSFAGDGSAEVDFSGNDDYALAVAIDANDNVVVVGQVGFSATDTDFGVARLRGSDGMLDTSFSSDGKATVLFDLGPSSKFDSAKAVAITPSTGQITVAGIAFDSAISRYRVAMARFKVDGTFDSTFCATSCTLQGSYTGINNGRRVYYFGANSAHSDGIAGIAVTGSGNIVIAGETYANDGSAKRAAVASFTANGNYGNERLDDGLTNNAAYRSVQLSDANGQRVLVSGDSGPTGNFLLLQAFDPNLNPLTGYGNCLNNTAFCFIGGTGIGDNGVDEAGALNMDHLGRPLFAGSFVVTASDPTKALYARFTNDSGPKPDRIFRNGFE